MTTKFSTVFFDFGGVITSSPFENFNALEVKLGIEKDFIRTLNGANPDTNAWAQFERNDIDPLQFDALFALESEAKGARIPGAYVLEALKTTIRPEMVALLKRLKSEGYRIACLTNNVSANGEDKASQQPQVQEALSLFETVVESSVEGVRKPEKAFYELALERMGVFPEQVVFLDDLGVNLKAAKQLGMTTIKVLSAKQAIDDLTKVLDLPTN